MKKKLYLISYILMLLPACDLIAQDARFYYEGTNYTGPYKNISLGQTVYVNSDGDAISIKILNPNVAIKATRVDGNWVPYPQGSIENYFVYTERNMLAVPGTDQYEDINIRVECIPKANTWQELPQPKIYVPFDCSDKNPNGGNDHNLKNLSDYTGKKVLVLRRAYIWENSEDVGGSHGPYGDMKLGAYKPEIFQYSMQELSSDCNNLGNSFLLGGKKSELPGPIWSGYAPIFLFPDPYDEWNDGPFGCIYSNIVVHDWGINPNPDDAVAVILSEADGCNAWISNPEDYIGGAIVKASSLNTPILIKINPVGFVVLENIDCTGRESSVKKDSKVFWYGNWNGRYPVDVYGPQSPAVPCETCPGNQFRPYTDDQYFSFNSNPAFYGYTVGLVGGSFPKGIYKEPRTFNAIDKPVTFGTREYKPTGIWLFSEPNYLGSSRFIAMDANDLGNSFYQFLDKASSVKLVNVNAVALYNQKYFQGQYVYITQNSPTLNPTIINNRAKSLKIYK